MKRCCATCISFDQNTRFCRFNPPTPMFDERKTKSRWPIISRPDTDFCEQYRPAQQSTEQCQEILPGSELIRG